MQKQTASRGPAAWKWLLLPWMGLVTVLALLWAQPLRSFPGDAESPRIIFWHVPMAMLGLLWFWIGAYHAVRYLYGSDRGNLRRDAFSQVADEIGMLCTVLATVSGMVFAQAQWNTPWNWDPKQVSIVVLIVIYMAYFGLRMSVEVPERRARFSAVYAIIGAVASPFLMFVLPQMVLPNTLHPQGVLTGGLDAKWRTIYWMSTLGFLGVTAWMVELRLRLLALLEPSEPASSSGATGEPPSRREAIRRPRSSEFQTSTSRNEG